MTGMEQNYRTPRVYTREQVAEILQLSLTSTAALIKSGAIRSFRAGPRVIRVRAQDLEAYMTGGGSSGSDREPLTEDDGLPLATPSALGALK